MPFHRSKTSAGEAARLVLDRVWGAVAEGSARKFRTIAERVDRAHAHTKWPQPAPIAITVTPSEWACILTDLVGRDPGDLPTERKYFLHARTSVRFRDLSVRLALACAMLSMLAPTAPVAGQSSAPEGPDPARALLDLDLRLGRLAGHAFPVGGGRALVELRPWLRFGGAVHIGLRHIRDAPERIGVARNLTLSYAGPVVEVTPPGSPFTGRLVVGAALATLRDDAVGTRVGSDISTVLVPELLVPAVRWRGVGTQLGAGVRFTLQSNGPGSVEPSDLRSVFVSFTVRFGPL